MTGRILTDARVATMAPGAGYGLIGAGAIAIKDGAVAHVGPELPVEFAEWPCESLGGRLVTPALIDCHTHLVFAGNRAAEFELRANGAGY